MGATKSTLFTKEQNEFARLAKALGHPARIAILQYLASIDTCVCGDIVEVLPLSQSTVSQHLKELKAAGIIQGEIDGKKVCYCINRERWEATKQLLLQFFENPKCC